MKFRHILAAAVLLGASAAQAALPSGGPPQPAFRYTFTTDDSFATASFTLTRSGFLLSDTVFEEYDSCTVTAPAGASCLATRFFPVVPGGSSDAILFSFIGQNDQGPSSSFFRFEQGIFNRYGTFNADEANATLTISDPNAVTGGVPEPQAWAMFIAGFGLTGAAVRRRRVAIAA